MSPSRYLYFSPTICIFSNICIPIPDLTIQYYCATSRLVEPMPPFSEKISISLSIFASEPNWHLNVWKKINLNNSICTHMIVAEFNKNSCWGVNQKVVTPLQVIGGQSCLSRLALRGLFLFWQQRRHWLCYIKEIEAIIFELIETYRNDRADFDLPLEISLP